ncbi:AraC family transcriptional regulator [Plebeiibacterium sediminum]|uniref:AraC family transcriptional regulator n=1 Tax=Plebeiibacterium sediminum TaxID=2992112 RepID=A0AAE3M901_9BACT|nr:AraC family transcriptional regulator [Plebeiobacterium sediminum]MCW3789434.1 AraC family transcriptional regulator [Plebeiobacterium sediminum]
MEDTFKIDLVNEIEAGKIDPAAYEPHTHDYEELIIGTNGQLEHFIDFKSTLYDAPLISFVTKGKVHLAKPKIKDDKCLMWVVRFKSEFIPESTFQLYSFYHNNASFSIGEGLCINRLNALCEMMSDEMKQDAPDYGIIRQLLSSLFTIIKSEWQKQHAEESQVQNSKSLAFSNFLTILEEHYKENVGVDFYAEKLFMTSRNLNLICRHIMQKSLSEIIETRKLLEAKNLLSTTDKTITEIGFELGFNEKAYFTNLFKKKTGQTPSGFRTDIKTMIS